MTQAENVARLIEVLDVVKMRGLKINWLLENEVGGWSANVRRGENILDTCIGRGPTMADAIIEAMKEVPDGNPEVDPFA